MPPTDEATGFGPRLAGDWVRSERFGEESGDPLVQERVHVPLVPKVCEGASRLVLSFPGIGFVHLVQQFDSVTKMEVVRSIDDLELGLRTQPIEERVNARLEVDEDIVAPGEDECCNLFCEWELVWREGFAPDEGLRGRRETAHGAHASFEGSHLERRPAAKRVAEYAEAGRVEVG